MKKYFSFFLLVQILFQEVPYKTFCKETVEEEERERVRERERENRKKEEKGGRKKRKREREKERKEKIKITFEQFVTVEHILFQSPEFP